MTDTDWKPGTPLYDRRSVSAPRQLFDLIPADDGMVGIYRRHSKAQVDRPDELRVYYFVCYPCLVSWTPGPYGGEECWNCGQNVLEKKTAAQGVQPSTVLL